MKPQMCDDFDLCRSQKVINRVTIQFPIHTVIKSIFTV